MDIKNYKITVGQLLDDERSRAILFKYAPLFLKHPLLITIRRMQLKDVISTAQRYVPKSQLDMIIKEIEKA